MRVKRPITIRIMPAISTFRSAESGCGAIGVILLRGDEVFLAVEVLDRVDCEVLFLVRLGAGDEVLVFFLFPVVFLDLDVVVLRAIRILLTFNWSTNYSMREREL